MSQVDHDQLRAEHDALRTDVRRLTNQVQQLSDQCARLRQTLQEHEQLFRRLSDELVRRAIEKQQLINDTASILEGVTSGKAQVSPGGVLLPPDDSPPIPARTE